MFRAPKRPRNQLPQTRLEPRTHQLAAQLRQSESGDPRYPPAEHRQHLSASTLRKTKFFVLAMAALASTAAELPPPMFEHLAMDQARCRNPHFTDQPAVERSTLSEITSASASERAFSIHGSLLLPIALVGNGLPFLNLSNDRRSE